MYSRTITFYQQITSAYNNELVAGWCLTRTRRCYVVFMNSRLTGLSQVAQ